MANSEADFARYAGPIRFPTSAEDLTNTTQCPACFTPLQSAVCLACRLDLQHPAASGLADVSADAAALLRGREELIGRIRFDSLARAAAERESATAPNRVSPIAAPSVAPQQAAAIPAPMAPLPSLTSPLARPLTSEPTPNSGPFRETAWQAPGAVPQQFSPGSPPIGTAPELPRRRSSVQLVLLIVGVSLLSIAAIFFLVYAFITFGLLVRTLIIAAITVAAFVGATLLHRKKLRGTAEAIAVFAVVLIYLDAFALKANDLLGLGATDGALYWGVTLLLSAGGFLLWHRVSGLGTPGIVAAVALPLGAGLAVGGATSGLDGGLRLFLAFLSVMLVGLLQAPLARGGDSGSASSPIVTVQRTILLCAALIGLFGAAVTGLFVLPELSWAPSGAYVALAVAAAAHVVVLTVPGRRRATARPLRIVFAVAGGGLLAFALAASVPRAYEPFPPLVFALLWAAMIALALELARGVRPTPPTDPVNPTNVASPTNPGFSSTISTPAPVEVWRPARTAAAWTAAAAATLLALAPLTVAIALTARTALGIPAVNPMRLEFPDQIADTHGDNGLALLGLTGLVVLASASWALGGRLRARLPILLWGAIAVAILAGPLFSTLGGVSAYWFVLGIGGLITLLLLLRSRRAPFRLLLPVAVGTVTATALGYLLSWGGTTTWWIATTLVIAMLLIARRLFSAPAPRAELLGIAAAVTLLGGGVLGTRLDPVAFGTSTTLTSAEVLCWVAVLILAAAAFGWGRVLSDIDRRTLFWIALPSAAISAALCWFAGAVSAAAASTWIIPLALGLVFLGALGVWSILRSTSAFRIERIVAALVIAPIAAWTLDSLARVLGLRDALGEVVPASAALLVAAGVLAASLLGTGSVPRWIRDAGIAVVAVPSVLSALATAQPLSWLVLFIAAITTLLLAVSPDGLFAARGDRKQLGWLALALATAGLWLLLWDTGTTRLELYVLPLAAALLGIAALTHRAARRAGLDSAAAPYIALAGALIAVVPLAAQSITGALWIAVLMTIVSAALLLLGSWLSGSATWRPYLAAAAVSGGLGVLVATVGRAAALVPSHQNDGPPFALDAWLLGGSLLLLCAALGQLRAIDRENSPPRRGAFLVTVLLATAPLLLTELLVLGVQPLGPIRAAILVALFSALYLVTTHSAPIPFRELLRWIMLGSAAMAAISGILQGALDPIELGTLPIAVALLITGTLQLARTPSARSWSSLGAGLVILLLPSLLATIVDRPLWRLVALGIVGVGVIIWGAARKLQAPLLLGSIVVLIHAIATFSPQIRAVYELTEWWLWAAVGGAILLFLGATYEKRIRDLRATVLRIGSLR